MLKKIEIESSKNKFIDFLENNKFNNNILFNRSLLDHLIGTYELSLKLKCDYDVCLASLFHNIYDENKAYKFKGISASNLTIIINLIGKEAENLVFLFFNGEYNKSLRKNLNKKNDYFIICNDKKIKICKSILIKLLDISAINILEQAYYFLKNDYVSSIKILNYIKPYETTPRLLSPLVYAEVKRCIDLCLNKN
ncbi:DUF6817 domain-containing protein [Fluviispira multicolorata]|uniref:DUF6817 domain-containing protein n=1 Tax=Fluviispira multicolorata TaxID=2654512 RepID=A0A833JD47_9BACT|nr:hypothetical protein [Fluviispira multicolorata]KAB8030720.1 hypothetical protein GCL57_07030 [Fluviispira multicolorata]